MCCTVMKAPKLTRGRVGTVAGKELHLWKQESETGGDDGLEKRTWSAELSNLKPHLYDYTVQPKINDHVIRSNYILLLCCCQVL